MLKRYKWFIDYYKKSYIIAIIALIFDYAFKLILPYMIGNVADLSLIHISEPTRQVR